MDDNVKIVKENVESIKKYYSNAVIVIATNPIDVITHKVCELMNLPCGKVFGIGCILDSSRFVRALPDYYDKDVSDIRALVIGEHGDGHVIIWSLATICGQGIEEYSKRNGII